MIGDLMSLDSLPGVTQVAIQSGRHAADTVSRRLAGDTTRRPFRYRDVGTMATVSRLRAIAVFGKVRISGFPAWVIWLLVRLTALTGSRTAFPSSLTGPSRSSGEGARSESSPRSRYSHVTRSKHTRAQAVLRRRL